MSYFDVFGLPRRLAIDAEALRVRFYELSRRWHPDFHQAASPDEQARALQESALVNAAYRTLRDPIARIEYLVRLEEGQETSEGATVKPEAPTDLLAEMFEIQEALADAKAGGLDEEARESLETERERLQARYDAEAVRLTGPLAASWDAAAPEERARIVAQLKKALAARAYLRTVIDDLGAALGEEQEGDVAHRRH